MPDILVGGKGLAGGYVPMAGLFARTSITQSLADKGQAFMFFTFGGQSSCAAIADRVLQIMQDEDLVGPLRAGRRQR